MILHVFGLSDLGKVRTGNEDAFLIESDHRLIAVADGMGGHAAGEVASQTALETLSADTIAPDEGSVRKAVEAANGAVYQRSIAEPDKAGMGTTLTVFRFDAAQSRAVLGHVGDSRAYRMRDGTLKQLTHDHTAAQEMVDRGQLTEKAARKHPLSSMLYRALGTRPDVDVDTEIVQIEAGDLFLLCSDGLSGMVDDDELQQILSEDKPLEALAQDLIDAANNGGGTDNITAVLIKAAN